MHEPNGQQSSSGFGQEHLFHSHLPGNTVFYLYTEMSTPYDIKRYKVIVIETAAGRERVPRAHLNSIFLLAFQPKDGRFDMKPFNLLGVRGCQKS